MIITVCIPFNFTLCSCNLNERSWSLWGRKSSHFKAVQESQATGNATQQHICQFEPTAMYVLLTITTMSSSLESELVTVRQEKESLTQQLLNTIKHKVVLSQELDAWQVSLCAGIWNSKWSFLAHFKSLSVQGEYCFSTWTFHLVAGGHAAGDQSAGAAEGGGETEGKTARERQHSRTPKKQVAESEGRRRERILLFPLQRQITAAV